MSLGTELFQWGPGAKPRYGGSGKRSPPNVEAIYRQTLFTDFDCRNDQNSKISHKNHLPILDQYVSRCGINDIWELSPMTY